MPKKIKILFISPVPKEGAGCRARIEQYLPYLMKENIVGVVRPFLFKEFFEIVYKRGRYLTKIFYFLRATLNRIYDALTIYRYEAVFIYRECFPFGPPIFEWLFYWLGLPIIYDFDDAIYLPSPTGSSNSKIFKFLKCYGKVSKIIRFSRHVIVCNDYLRDYAKRFNPNVTMIPTPIETENFTFKKSNIRTGIIIGWIGTHSTAEYLEQLRTVFQRLAKKHDFILKIVGAGREFNVPGVHILSKDWRLEDEIRDFQSLDIGVYPLGGTEFDLGKTGFKIIVYMAVGVPAVVSDFGRNREIVQDGINGFLAGSEDEWVNKLSLLIEDSALRQAIGLRGRATVEEKYSVKANAPKILDVLKKALFKEKQSLCGRDY